MNWIEENDDLISQEYVDRYFEDTRDLSLDVDSQKKAIDLLKRIHYLEYVSDEYFVAEDIAEWKKRAMTHIDSAEIYFQKVLYDIFRHCHLNFTDSLHSLEASVANDAVSEEVIFSMVKSFNEDMKITNESCKRYGMPKFDEYRFESSLLQEHYDEWLNVNQ